MKTIVPIVSFLFMGCVGLSAQTFEVPENYHLNVKTDYTFYEPDVVKCVDWLINTRIDQETEKRQAASSFLLQWCMGTPTINVVIDENVVSPITDKQVPDYVLLFMGGWAKDAIESDARHTTIASSKESKDEMLAGNVAGLEAVLAFYETNKGLVPANENIEKLLKLQQKGRLEKYVKKLLPKASVPKK